MIFDIEDWLKVRIFRIFTARFIIGRWSAKDLLKSESAYFHSINPGFDAENAEKFLNVI